MATIELRQVEKKFGELHAVKPMELTVQDGEFVVLLGPSGCGKTTTLRMISGLETVTGGTIWLDERNVTWLHPSQRDIAFVFQFYALYPHLTAGQNISFPLQAQGESRETIEKRVKEVVDLLRIRHLLHLRPGNLSGGDQQRIALARALVRRPAAFLMDEPLGALDAEFREAMRAEIKRLHIEQHATTVYVTHDQIEAMAMGDRIVVMSDAVVQQVGTPAEVYHKPANLFVARFIGSPGMNLAAGQYADGVVSLPGSNKLTLPPDWRLALDEALGGEGEVMVGFRPEAAMISDEGTLVGEVYATDMHGAYTMLHVNMNEFDIVHIRSDRLIRFPIGTPVRFDIGPEMARFFDPKTEAAITRRSTSE
ncbi:MAG: ABC transporter ATP-binding protein [Anaerolineales bacterium]|nr:MAG: ABC transporter ATP-binding protein [Anaerolineales bacterium]